MSCEQERENILSYVMLWKKTLRQQTVFVGLAEDVLWSECGDKGNRDKLRVFVRVLCQPRAKLYEFLWKLWGWSLCTDEVMLLSWPIELIAKNSGNFEKSSLWNSFLSTKGNFFIYTDIMTESLLIITNFLNLSAVISKVVIPTSSMWIEDLKNKKSLWQTAMKICKWSFKIAGLFRINLPKTEKEKRKVGKMKIDKVFARMNLNWRRQQEDLIHIQLS